MPLKPRLKDWKGLNMKNRSLMTLGLLPLTLVMTSCAMMTGSVETSPATPTFARFCKTYEPILWSTQDTDETIRQVKRENAKWKAICEKEKSDGPE